MLELVFNELFLRRYSSYRESAIVHVSDYRNEAMLHSAFTFEEDPITGGVEVLMLRTTNTGEEKTIV